MNPRTHVHVTSSRSCQPSMSLHSLIIKEGIAYARSQSQASPFASLPLSSCGLSIYYTLHYQRSKCAEFLFGLFSLRLNHCIHTYM